MGTVIRPEISVKNTYWLPKHRYYELKHFCLQYPEWKKNYICLDGLPSRSSIVTEHVDGGMLSDPTAVYTHFGETITQDGFGRLSRRIFPQ